MLTLNAGIELRARVSAGPNAAALVEGAQLWVRLPRR